MFKKILIANRGEIAVRIIRACREMGILTVAVCSEADKDALHAQLADETICIGAPMAKDSYLNMESIISATLVSGAEAIHPGFGFLSENSKFVKMCQQCNITFIGPSAQTIDKMGNKSEARNTMIQAGVPVVPGTKEPIYEASVGLERAREIGYPIMIKASSGGGGKGMRIAESEEEFLEKFETAQREALNGFGDDTMYLERCIRNPRHVEIQILADQYGNTIYLGERDCSIQRRHQKMIEESPSCAIDEELRKKMGEAAVKGAKAANYYSAGTIEFLLDQNNEFYFMEMNTRIQVEHPVTEMVTGIDLIKEQIKIAAGEKLTIAQEDVKIQGHAIECRINAEDPDKNFMPCPGTVNYIHFPGGKGIRVDSALYAGYTIPPYYDSMVAKLIVHDETRELAIQKMRSALGELIVQGVKTNLDYQYEILNDNEYVQGNVDTGFIERFQKRFEEME
ncbi:MAG: acetyl-CoA carboxylase biotin carboxylase subunit [Firmicutes bacterium]|uniref:Biotin carboxylase n=1 Tax=Candidatus Scybalomonas excrementavium TaxID=2840943 RepID=A0A9D9N826_9FIRM|nr:acetyl-CoA carboxylase biotin carboxylase subunit [Candidatus Scybalomonas excrementavium]